jgi:hypothetical protein
MSKMTPKIKYIEDQIAFFNELDELLIKYDVSSIEVEEDSGYSGCYPTGISFNFRWAYSDGVADEYARYGGYTTLPTRIYNNSIQDVVERLQKELDEELKSS